jgi:hypothetical protein
MSVSARFDAQRFADETLEGRGVACRRPDFQLGIATRPRLQERVFAAMVQFYSGDRL